MRQEQLKELKVVELPGCWLIRAFWQAGKDWQEQRVAPAARESPAFLERHAVAEHWEPAMVAVDRRVPELKELQAKDGRALAAMVLPAPPLCDGQQGCRERATTAGPMCFLTVGARAEIGARTVPAHPVQVRSVPLELVS